MKQKFEQVLPEGARLLYEAKVNRKPPMPEQTAFVHAWPFEDIREKIAEKTGVLVNPPGLLLYGPTGTGKTTAIYWLIKKYWDQFRARNYQTPGVVNLSGGQLAVELIEASLGRSESYNTLAEMIEVLSGCKVLFLDELDKMNITNAVLKHFAEIIRKRHLEPFIHLFTTTNATPTTMLAKADRETRGPLRRRIIDQTVAVDFGDDHFRCSEMLQKVGALFQDRADREAIAEEEARKEAKEEAERLAEEEAERQAQAEKERQERETRAAAERQQIEQAIQAGDLDVLPNHLRARLTFSQLFDAGINSRKRECQRMRDEGRIPPQWPDE